MKVAIIEICEPNHYTAVEALALTYANQPDNHIAVFTLANFSSFTSLKKEKNIFLNIKPSDVSIGEFLQYINGESFDVIHINTISKYYNQFAAVSWVNLVLTIHNVETWFDHPFKSQLALLKYRLRNTNGDIKQRVYLPIKYFTKEFFWQKHREKLVHGIYQKKQKVLVYSESQKNFLSKYMFDKQIIVFPFCVRKYAPDLSINNKILRVCIPGSVDNHRRDYDGLFSLLKQNHQHFKNLISIDLLGYIPQKESNIVSQVKELQKLGIMVYFNEFFINDETYNQRLQLCDIILGNLRPSLSGQSKYGETKETGVIFNMIRAAKPGIFPITYPIDETLRPICLVYDNDLQRLLLGLIQDNEQLYTLKLKALEIAKLYEPKILYPQLIKQLN